MARRAWLGFLLVSTVVIATVVPGFTQAKPPVVVALVAAMSGGSALSGEAIKRGLTVAIDEINAKGGVLGGRKVELVIRDEEGNPSKGVTAARSFPPARWMGSAKARERVAEAWRAGGPLNAWLLAHVGPADVER